MSEENRLGTEKIGKLLFLFSVPSVVSLVLNALYNMVDQIFIGQGVGYLGNGATNVIFPMTQLAVAIGLLIGDGTAAFMNLKMGTGDRKSAEKGMASGILGLCISGVVLLILYNLFLTPLCRLFGATDLIMSYAIDYGRIISLGMLFCVFASGSMSMVRADGSPKIAMIGMVTGCVINLIGDPLTIFVLGWGVKGAALATIAGQFANAAINVWYFTRCKSVKLKRESFQGSLSYLPKASRLGLSSFSTQMAIVVVITVQNNLLVKYGAMSRYGAEIPMTALGVTMKVFTLLQCAISGLCSGAQPIISYNYGSRKYDRVKATLKALLMISVAIMTAATIWFQAAPMSIVNIFGSSDALYNEFSMKCLRIYLMLVIMDAFQMVGSSFLQSVGKPLPASMLVLFRQIIILIPGMLIMAALTGVEGILWSGAIASALVGSVAIIILLRERKALSVSENENTLKLKA